VAQVSWTSFPEQAAMITWVADSEVFAFRNGSNSGNLSMIALQTAKELLKVE
jgi:hypothetical protein